MAGSAKPSPVSVDRVDLGVARIWPTNLEAEVLALLPLGVQCDILLMCFGSLIEI